LFHFSVFDLCNKPVNNIYDGINESCNKSVNNIYDGINESDDGVWHSCLCHLNFGSMSRLSSLNLIPNLSIVKGFKCQSSVQSNQTQTSHKATEGRHLAPLELIHSNICKMNGVLSKGEQRYFITIIDDVSRYCYVYLLKTKHEALNCFKICNAELENQLEKKIKIFKYDQGGEYFSNEFDLFCMEYDIIHEKTPPYSPPIKWGYQKKQSHID
jgi:hypothetical protein